MSSAPLPVRPAVETFEWIDLAEACLSDLVEKFARVHILVSLFDGDPDRWMEAIGKYGTTSERQYDIPFVHEIKERLREDPFFLDQLRRSVKDFSELFARTAGTS